MEHVTIIFFSLLIYIVHYKNGSWFEIEVMALEDQIYNLTIDVEKLKESKAILECKKDCVVCFKELKRLSIMHIKDTTS